MSRTLHVATTYQVKWGNTSNFNYKVYEFHSLLTVLGIEFTGEYYDSDFEVEEEQFTQGAWDLEHFSELPEAKQGNIKTVLEVLECTIDEAATAFWNYLEEADSNDGYLHFSFF